MPVNKDYYTLAGSSGQSTGYTIDQSIRFARASNTSGNYMQRNFGSAGDRTSWTWSCWFKLGSLNNFTPASGLYYQFFACDYAKNDAGRGSFHIVADTSVSSHVRFQFQGHGTNFMRTTRQFRDPSAWMHLVLVWDSDHAVANDRQRLYINGVRETDFATFSNPSAGQEIGINLGEIHRLGISYNISGAAVNYPFDGYMADIHFLDGYSYGPEYFGESDSYGIWIPKEYTGSYGSNGFKIDGRDSSDLGDDESGNGNDFTETNFDTSDQSNDTPTNNTCVWNPLRPTGSQVMTEGNLRVDTSSGTYESIHGTIGIPPNSGIFYYEGVVHSHTIQLSFGWGSSDMGVNQNNNPATPKYFMYSDYNGKYYSSGGDGTVGDGFTNNDVIGCWIDTDSTSNNLKFYRNGTLQSTHSFDFSDVDHIMPLTQHLNTCAVTGRFSADEWTQAPSGITDANAITTNNVGS